MSIALARRLATVCGAVAVGLTLPVPRPASGQQPPAPRDSAGRDSVRVGPADNYLLLLLFPIAAAEVATVVVAPPTLMLLPGVRPAQARFAPPADHLAFRASGRVLGDTAQTGGHSESVEWLHAGRYVEVRLATWYVPRTFQYQTVRVGRFVQARPSVYGGVTLGYQRAPRDWTQEGPELAVPLLLGGSRLGFRAEPSYVFSAKRVNLSYRMLAEARMAGAWWGGLEFELKGIREPTPYTGGLSLVFGYRAP